MRRSNTKHRPTTDGDTSGIAHWGSRRWLASVSAMVGSFGPPPEPRSLSEKCGFRTLSRYPSRSTDSHTSSGADTGFGHVALSAFSEAKLTENDAPGCLGTATEAY